MREVQQCLELPSAAVEYIIRKLQAQHAADFKEALLEQVGGGGCCSSGRCWGHSSAARLWLQCMQPAGCSQLGAWATSGPELQPHASRRPALTAPAHAAAPSLSSPPSPQMLPEIEAVQEALRAGGADCRQALSSLAAKLCKMAQEHTKLMEEAKAPLGALAACVHIIRVHVNKRLMVHKVGGMWPPLLLWQAEA